MARFLLVLILLLGAAGAGVAEPAENGAAAAALLPPANAAIEALLEGNDALRLDGHALDRAALAAIYRARSFAPVWTEERQESFLHALEEADSHGLDPTSYGVADTKPAERDLLFTDAFVRYASALTRGRVAPASFETDWRIDPPAFDAEKTLQDALSGDVATVLKGLAPQDPAYDRLRNALVHYEALAAKPWQSLWAGTLKPGDRNENVGQLRDRLAAEGYATAAATDPEQYDEGLAAAVTAFQRTHGLPLDGAVGKATLAALNVSPSLRVRQIRWNLERWRSLPRIDATTRIEVNAAAAIATLYLDNQPPKPMRAIVGASVHPTPVFRARMWGVLFNPPWVVPASIVQKEIGPMLKRDPDYLKRFGFVYQDRNGGKELVQQPGPTNSLGLVKFEMPNPDDVYMHDTPERQLFALARRYISHGCVRVEDPRELARMLLDSDAWSRPAIDAAIATGHSQSVTFKRSLPVYMLYWTAYVDADGTVEFRDDVYGRDRRLAEALANQAAQTRLAAKPRTAVTGIAAR